VDEEGAHDVEGAFSARAAVQYSRRRRLTIAEVCVPS
jgi:hypothetical protein